MTRAGSAKNRITRPCGAPAYGLPQEETRMSMQPTILAIDNGTQSVRALLFDLQGNIVAKSQVMLEAYFSEQPGWAEHDPEDYWQALCKACQGLWSQPGVHKAPCRAWP
jgi:glycerol kinase